MMNQPKGYRWAVLFSYMLTGLVSQLIWITFAPILSTAVQTYGVTQAEIGYLSAVFPLVYVFISIPVGHFIDSQGFRKAVLIGTGFMGIFGLLRAFSTDFTVLLIFQTLAAIGQPFIMNSISKLVKSWFPERESGLATGIGSLSLYFGTLLGLVLTPILIELFSLFYVLLIYGSFSLVVLLTFFILGKESSTHLEDREFVEFRKSIWLFKNRNIQSLSVLFLICMGVFTAFTTWIEPMLGNQGVQADGAGLIGGLMIIGGVIGSVVFPWISDRSKLRKRPLVILLVISTFLWYALSFAFGFVQVSIVLFAIGAFFMAALPLSLTIAAESVDRAYVGAASSILYEFSQIGSLVLIVLYEAVAISYSWNVVIVISAALVLISVLASLLIIERLHGS